jgi:hypothetical protein
MSVKKFMAPVMALLIAAVSIGLIATPADAGERRGRHYGQHESYRGDHGRHGIAHHSWRRGGDYGHNGHRSHRGRNLAIGAAAAILGLAIVAGANRDHRDYDEDYE